MSTTTISTGTQEFLAVAQQLDSIATQGLSIETTGFVKAFQIANSISSLRAALTDTVMEPIMALQGSPLGFRTDKDKDGGYPIHVVRECLISAILKGVQPYGNQFNIISGRDYITKEGFTHLLMQITDLQYNILHGIARTKDAGAIAAPMLRWKRAGEKDWHEQQLELAIPVNNGMGHDAIIGKADRKAKCWLYNQVTGNTYTDADATDDDSARPARNITPTGATISGNPLAGNPPPATNPEPEQESEPTPDFVLDSPLIVLDQLMEANGITKPEIINYCRDRKIYYTPAVPWAEMLTDQARNYLIDTFDDVRVAIKSKTSKK